MKIALTLSAISLACVLSACGGDDDDSTSSNPGVTKSSIVQCFTANETVNYNTRVTISGSPANTSITMKITDGPMIYNGEKVMGRKGTEFASSPGSSSYEITARDYWKITDKGVEDLGGIVDPVRRNNIESSDEVRISYADNTLPTDMKPGDYVEFTEIATNMRTGSKTNARSRTTFVGVEPTFTVDTPTGKKTFANVCHIKKQDLTNSGAPAEQWIAPGHITIKNVQIIDGSTVTMLYSGNQ
jgi:hypothetical protein